MEQVPLPESQTPSLSVDSLQHAKESSAMGESLPALLRQRGEVEEESAQALFVKTKAAQEKELGIEWEITSWKQYAYKVTRVGRALIAMGILPGTKAIMLGQTKVESILFYMGCMSVGVVPVPLYPTLSPEELEKTVNHSTAELAFVVSPAQLKMLSVAPACPGLKRIIYHSQQSPLDKETTQQSPTEGAALTIAFPQFLGYSEQSTDTAFLERMGSIRPDQLATIVYTASLLRDDPQDDVSNKHGGDTQHWHLKGVMLSHANLLFTAKALAGALAVTDADTSVSFLPLCHPLQQLITIHIPILTGSQIFVNGGKMKKLLFHLHRVQPTYLFAPALFWKKIYSAVKQTLDDLLDRLKEEEEDEFEEEEATQRLIHQEAPFLRHSLKAAGFRRLRVGVSGLTPLPAAIASFLKDTLKLKLQECYVHPESTGIISCHPLGSDAADHPHTLGLPLSGVKVKSEPPNGELVISGGNVFIGYWQDQQATQEVLKDGRLYTGDLGEVDEQGWVTLVGKKAEMIRLRTEGHVLSPSKIETLLRGHPVIEEALVIGNDREYLTAVLNPIKLSSRKRKAGVQAIQEHVGRVNRSLDPSERVRKVKISTKPYSVNQGHINHVQKLRRNFLLQHFAKEIAEMYEEQPPNPAAPSEQSESTTTTTTTPTPTPTTTTEEPHQQDAAPTPAAAPAVVEAQPAATPKEEEAKSDDVKFVAAGQVEEAQAVTPRDHDVDQPPTHESSSQPAKEETHHEEPKEEKQEDNQKRRRRNRGKKTAAAKAKEAEPAQVAKEEKHHEEEKDKEDDAKEHQISSKELDDEEAALDKWIADQEKKMKGGAGGESHTGTDQPKEEEVQDKHEEVHKETTRTTKEKEEDKEHDDEKDRTKKPNGKREDHHKEEKKQEAAKRAPRQLTEEEELEFQKKKIAKQQERERKQKEREAKQAERDEELEQILEENRKKREEGERRRQERIEEEMRLRDEEERRVKEAVEQADREQLLRQIKDLQGRLRAEQDELSSALSKEEDTRRKLEDSEAKVHSTQKLVLKKEQKKRDVQKQLDKLREQVFIEEENLEEEKVRVSMVTQEKERMLRELDDLEVSKRRVEKELTNVHDHLAQEERERKRLEKENQLLLDQLKAIDKLREKIDRNKKIVASLVKNEDRQKEQIRELQRQRDSYQSDKGRVERNVENLEMDNSELRSRVEEETRNKLSFEDAKRRLEAKVRELTDQLDEESDANRELRNKNRKLTRELRFKQQQGNGSFEAIADAGKVRMLQAELNRLTERMAVLTEERDLLQRKVAASSVHHHGPTPTVSFDLDDDDEEAEHHRPHRRAKTSLSDDDEEDSRPHHIDEDEKAALMAKAKRVLEESDEDDDDECFILDERRGSNHLEEGTGFDLEEDD